MTQRTRKLIGTFGLLALVIGYTIGVAAIYVSFLQAQPWWVLILFFAVAGLGWFFPAAWMVRWMARPDA